MDEKVSVIIADDHEIYRAGLSHLLSKSSKVEVVGEAKNSSELYQLIKKKEPDIIFLDIFLGNDDGVMITKKIKAIHPFIYIVVITASDGIRSFHDMLKADADGFLLKNISEKELNRAVVEILKGKKSFSKEFSIIEKAMSPVKKGKETQIKITKREESVLRLICQGLSNQEIADKLGFSYHTADAHRRSIILKTGAKNTAEMIMISCRKGLIGPI